MSLSSKKALKSSFNIPNVHYCEFCGRECKNINSYKQHLCRCKKNPQRIESSTSEYRRKVYVSLPEDTKIRMIWNKGLTADMDERVAKTANFHKSLKNTNYEDNVYAEYNNNEINKWFSYIKNIEVVQDFNTSCTKNSYPIIKEAQKRVGNTVKICFVHDYVANILLADKLNELNVVHHIDKDRKNFDKYNLMIFETSADHKRFHNSKYAKLKYNETTHLFTSFIDKPIE